MSDRAPLIASALKYSARNSAPQVIAQGEGRNAERILELAAANNIDIVQNERLAAELHSLDVGREIPEQLYVIVAEILSVIFRARAS